MALYVFDIKYIPGKTFVKSSIEQRIHREDPYSELLKEAIPVSTNLVHNAGGQAVLFVLKINLSLRKRNLLS